VRLDLKGVYEIRLVGCVKIGSLKCAFDQIACANHSHLYVRLD